MAWKNDNCFRRDAGPGPTDQNMFRIPKSLTSVAVFLHVLANRVGRRAGIRIDQTKGHTLWLELRLELLYFGGVTMGDWTVTSGEKIDYSSVAL